MHRAGKGAGGRTSRYIWDLHPVDRSRSSGLARTVQSPPPPGLVPGLLHSTRDRRGARGGWARSWSTGLSHPHLCSAPPCDDHDCKHKASSSHPPPARHCSHPSPVAPWWVHGSLPTQRRVLSMLVHDTRTCKALHAQGDSFGAASFAPLQVFTTLRGHRPAKPRVCAVQLFISCITSWATFPNASTHRLSTKHLLRPAFPDAALCSGGLKEEPRCSQPTRTANVRQL